MSDLTPAQIEIAKAMSEDELLTNVIAAAHRFGWLVCHIRPARTGKKYYNKKGELKEAWNTPIQGDAGLDDVILARNGVVWFLELKKEDGTLSEAQKKWYHALPNCLVVKPRNWLSGEVEELLR